MVLADDSRRFVQEIAAVVSDLGVDFLDFCLGFFPIVAEFLFVRHAPLVFGKFSGFGFKAVERCNVTAVRKCGKPCYTKVDTDGCCSLRGWQFYFPPSLDANKPLAVFAGNRNISEFTQDIAAVAVAYPAQFGQENPAVVLVELDLLRVRKA